MTRTPLPSPSPPAPRSPRSAPRSTRAVAALTAGLVLAALAVACSSSSKPVVSANGTGSTQTTVGADAGSASAAGKPCVARTGALPSGAPDVPVVVGPAPTSLVIKDLKVGTGPAATATDTVTVNYIGVACSTGEIFDSSWSRGQPATFALNQVIPGWTQGLTGMQVGGRRLLGIPSNLAYGAQGSPPQIAPDEALWFVVDLVKISS